MTRLTVCGSLCLLALAHVSVSGCSRKAKEEASGPALPVTTASAALGSITAVIQTVGTVTAAPGAEQIVTAPEPGRIVELPKNEHDRVTEGEPLVRFEIASVVSDIAKQSADVARAQVRLDAARAASARAKDLFDRGLAPRMNVDEAESQVTAAEAEVRVAKSTADAAAASSGARAVVRAAFDGVVAQRLKDVGDLVEPGTSAILVVVDPNRLEVTATLPYIEAARIGIGGTARITQAPDAAVVSGLHVVFRPESALDRNAPVPVRLSFDSPPTITLGAEVQLVVNAETHDGTLLVPLAAIQHDGDATSVFVISNGLAQRRPVVVGITDAEHAEIVSGLDRDEIVVTDGQNALFDGAKVAVQAAAEPAK